MIIPSRFVNKKLIVFDLDGTLTKTKSDMESDMSHALTSLLEVRQIAIIGGGSYQQFKKQFLKNFKCPPSLLSKLYLFPTTATSFYRYDGGWKKVYGFELSKKERAHIKKAFKEVLAEIHYVPPKKIYGKVLEDRGSQITFSALGQDVVEALGTKGVRLKEQWTREHTPLKLKIARLVQRRLPHFEVRAAGFTSIDVVKKGIDKAYGLRQIEKNLRLKISEMLFLGDAIFPGGNDYAVVKSHVDYVKVKGPAETKRVIKYIIRT